MYQRYGGRGISVCERWLKFENFLKDMGECPKNKEIDRIDYNGNYDVNNCRWVTRVDQARNKCDSINITFKGVTQTIIEWSADTGIKYATLYKRIITKKWDIEKALSQKCRVYHTKNTAADGK